MEPLTRKEFFLNAIAEGTPTPPPLTREERYLAKIAENTGGDSLPPIEEGDDGKVLTVSSGEAVWASGGGGSTELADLYDIVVMTSERESSTASDYQLVKGSYDDVLAKMSDGKPVNAVLIVNTNSSEDDEIISYDTAWINIHLITLDLASEKIYLSGDISYCNDDGSGNIEDISYETFYLEIEGDNITSATYTYASKSFV